MMKRKGREVHDEEEGEGVEGKGREKERGSRAP